MQQFWLGVFKRFSFPEHAFWNARYLHPVRAYEAESCSVAEYHH